MGFSEGDSSAPFGDPNSTSSEAAMSDDVSVEILTRLPLKSLFRFKCASKAWHRLISDDYLRRRLPLLTSAVFYHSTDDDTSNGPRFACTSSGDLRECNLDFFPFYRESIITDCCSGLLLSFSSFRSTFYVISPITKRWVALPKPHKRTQLSMLAFDPYHSSEYKVISFTGWLAQGSELEVFSSETGIWVEQTVHWGINSDSMTTTLRYFAGVLYVLAYPSHTVAVDLDMNRCRLMELPESAKLDGRIDRSAGVLHYTHNDGSQLKIWMHKDSTSGDEWVLKHRINVGAILGRLPATIHHQLHCLALHPEREVVYLRVPGKLVAYDLSKNKVEEVFAFEKEREKAYVVNMWLFPFSRHMSDCLARLKAVEMSPGDPKECGI